MVLLQPHWNVELTSLALPVAASAFIGRPLAHGAGPLPNCLAWTGVTLQPDLFCVDRQCVKQYVSAPFCKYLAPLHHHRIPSPAHLSCLGG